MKIVKAYNIGWELLQRDLDGKTGVLGRYAVDFAGAQSFIFFIEALKQKN